MSWKFDNSSPIYIQIMEQIKRMIARGELKPGDRVPAVRDMALAAGVNPNTMQKALSELERAGILISNRTAGRFVADLNDNNINLKNDAGYKLTKSYVEGMRELGFNDGELVDEVNKFING